MANLIDVGTAGLAIQDTLYDNMGEITPEVEAALMDLLAKGEEALDAGAWVVRKLEADRDALKAEAERYAVRAKQFDNAVERLKARMLFAVDAAFSGKLKTAKNTIWGQNSAATLAIEVAPDTDLAKLDVTDSELVRKTYELDKVAVKRRYEAGDPIPNAITVTEQPGTRYLRIK